MVIVTSSYAKSEKMSVTKTKGRNSHKFEERFIELNKKVDQLEE